MSDAAAERAMISARARSNSFNLAPELDLPRERGAPCPLPGRPDEIASIAAGAPDRAAFLRFKDRMRLFRTATTDFTDGEVAETKRLGQLYMDVSSKAFPDDFASDLRKLVLEPECRACAELSRCPGCYGARAEDAFAADEAHVRTILGRLDGDVLDVGAGHAPYAAELESAARVGAVRYLALEPDAERLGVLASRHPWAETRAGTLGDLAGEARRFRHILFLRSYNHLPDRDAAIAQAVELLEPRGTLLVVDDVAFGLLRSREQVQRAETGPARFEHFGNETATEAQRRFEGHPLALIERRDVVPERSNLWLLHFRLSDKGP